MKGMGAALGFGLVLTGSIAAHAQQGVGDPDHTNDGRTPDGKVDRPHGMAELGVGLLTLPGAQVCVERDTAGCEQGDTSLMLEAWQLYRANRSFALGAGITLGLTPTTDAPRRDPEGIERDHSRGYLTVETMARYYPFHSGPFEAWAGLTAGLVVVSDTFKSTDEFGDKALVGPRGVTIRTEGYTVGLGVGGAYQFVTNWSLGGSLRYGSWFLPQEPETDPLGDEASLTGRNSTVVIAVNVAYRIPLYF